MHIIDHGDPGPKSGRFCFRDPIPVVQVQSATQADTRVCQRLNLQNHKRPRQAGSGPGAKMKLLSHRYNGE